VNLSATNFKESQRWRIRSRDVKDVFRILILFPLAWLVPERRWAGLCHRLSWFIGHRTRRPGLGQGDSVYNAQRFWAVRAESQLQYYREYRPGGWPARIAVDGLGHVEAAQSKGQGVILWVAYQVFASLVVKKGLCEAGLAVHHLSMPIHGLSTTRLGIRYLNPIVTRIEDRYLAERIQYHPGRPAKAVAAMQRRLRDGLVLSITAGVGRRSKVPVPVLGGDRILPVSLGPLKLARRAGAVLLPCYIDRAQDGTFTVHITPPLVLDTADDPNTAAANALRELGARLTPAIAAQPLLWRLRRRGPDGAAPDRSGI
jgi:lauroyl/myristoyl acyltransferase